jgi:uncharacterized membrane protein YccC
MRARMSGLTDLVAEAFRTEDRGVDWRSGVAGAIAAVGPLAVGLAIDEPEAGFTATLGGLNAALCVPRGALRARVWWGVLAVTGQTGALVVAELAEAGDVALVALSFAWVLVWAFFRAAGPSGALLGFATSAVMVILAGIPSSAPLGDRLVWFTLGGVPGVALMIAARAGHPDTVPFGAAVLRAVRAAPLGDAALRGHALRLASAVAAGTVIYLAIGLRHGYWVPLTTLAILQPSEHGTRVRSVQRAAGTLAGAALIVAIVLVTDHRWPLVACAALAGFSLYALHERGYFWLVVLLTPTVLLMLSAVAFEGDDVALDRIADSTLGIVVGLAVAEIVRAVALRSRAPRTPATGGSGRRP